MNSEIGWKNVKTLKSNLIGFFIYLLQCRLLFIKAMVKIQNSKFGMVFLVKICDETYMHLHMKWWFLIFSFHSLTTLCGSATTIAKPQRAINVKIVNFIIFYVIDLITVLSLTFNWTVGETCIAFLKLFLRASANQETVQLDPMRVSKPPTVSS